MTALDNDQQTGPMIVRHRELQSPNSARNKDASRWPLAVRFNLDREGALVNERVDPPSLPNE